MKKVKDEGLDEDTLVAFTTDNGTENFTWPRSSTVRRGPGARPSGSACRAWWSRWPGKNPLEVENGLMSGLDWLPTLGSPPPADLEDRG